MGSQPPATPFPESYSSLSLPGLQLRHHPASAPTATPVLVVALHRPGALNAFTDGMAESLVRALGLASADPRVRAVVLTSSDADNRVFCAGMDLREGGALPERADRHRDQGGRVALAVFRCAKPVVAAVNGSAVGVGITMTLGANVRVASRDAKVGFVFGRRGFTLEACSSFFLPRLVGAARALHLVSTGAVYPAGHSLFGPLFSEVVAPDQVLPTALALAEDMAANVSLLASRLMKDLIFRAPASPEEAHLLESKIFHGLVLGPDAREGRESFLEKRQPDFQATLDDAPEPYPWWPPVDVRVESKL